VYKKNIELKKQRAMLCVLLSVMLSIPSLPCFAQSGLSNIGSFFNKKKIDDEDKSKSDALTIKEIVVEGNRLISKENILETINSKVGTAFDREKVLIDLESIDKLGYFVHESIQASPEQSKDGVLLRIKIEENNPITRVQILGNKLINSEELSSVVQDLSGKPESITKISESLDQIEKKYQEKGYLLAKVKGIDLDPDGTLSIDLNEGVLDKVLIKGNTKTKEKYIKRLTPNLVSGEPYNEILLVQDFRALQSTGFFEDVQRVLAPSAQFPDKYDLTIEVKEKRTASFGFGGGLNSLNGAFANAGFSNNNLFGEGKSISFNGQYGSGLLANTLVTQRFLSNRKTYQVEARYTDPNFRDTKNSLSLFTHGYTYNSYLIDLAQEKNFAIGASLMRPLGKNLNGGIDLIGEAVDMKEYGDQAQDFLVKQLQNIDNGKLIGNFSDSGLFKPGQSYGGHLSDEQKIAAGKAAQKIRKEQLQGGKYINFNPSLVYDNRDNALSATKGKYGRLTFGQAVGIGNGSFTKLGVDLRKYIPIGQKSTLAFNVQGSSALISDIPMYNQFKAGGYYGVRGYRSFSDLGIGKRSVLTSAEYRMPVLDTIPGFKNTPIGQNLKLALFSDFGYVGGNHNINRVFNRLDTAASAGIGVRANIPVLGPIRVDYGIPFMKSYWNSKNVLGRFNFGFGERF